VRRWTGILAAIAALVLAVMLALELREVSLVGWVFVAAFAAAPIAVYLGLTRARTQTGDRVALGTVLVAYVALFALAAPHYDEDAQGGLIFFFLPIYGVLALLLVLVVCMAVRAILERISEVRRGPPGGPTSAAAERP
jgi:hypothetical protein